MAIVHVDGKKKGKVMLYALSTCGWCKKTKALLNELEVEYDYIDVDLLRGTEQDKILNDVMKYNPSSNFPTMVIDAKKYIIGFKEDEIREAFK